MRYGLLISYIFLHNLLLYRYLPSFVVMSGYPDTFEGSGGGNSGIGGKGSASMVGQGSFTSPSTVEAQQQLREPTAATLLLGKGSSCSSSVETFTSAIRSTGISCS